MRATELFEQSTDTADWKQVTSLTSEQTVNILQIECTRAWGVYKQHRLKAYRGITSKKPLRFLGRTHQNRQPMTSPKGLQDLVDQALRSELGPDAAVRGNSIFVTGDSTQALGYGDLHVIFPKDTARFTWSPRYDDIVLDPRAKEWSEFKTLSHLPEFQQWLDLLENHPELSRDTDLNQLIHWFETNTNYWDWWRQDLPEKLMGMPAPVWQAAKQSGFASFLHPYPHRILELYQLGLAEFSPKLFLDKFQPQDTDWEQALRSRHEIYVSGEYVAIEAEHFLMMAVRGELS